MGRANVVAGTGAALKLQINKSDRNDAVGIARIKQCGWYKEVSIKHLDSHAINALLVSRALLVKLKRDLENQIRGLLKNLGLVIGQAKMSTFNARATEMIADKPALTAAVEPLLKAREAIEQQIDDLDRKVMRLARNEPQVRRFMTVPSGQVNFADRCARQATTEQLHDPPSSVMDLRHLVSINSL